MYSKNVKILSDYLDFLWEHPPAPPEHSFLVYVGAGSLRPSSILHPTAALSPLLGVDAAQSKG